MDLFEAGLPEELFELDKELTTMAGEPEGGSARVLLWQEGIKALPQAVLLGSGSDTFYRVSPEKFAARYGEGAAGTQSP